MNGGSLNTLFLVVCYSYIFGIGLSNVFSGSQSVIFVVLLIGVLFLNIFIYTRKLLVFVIIAFVGVSLGVYISSSAFSDLASKNNFLQQCSYAKQDIEFEVIELHSDEGYRKKYRIELLKIGDSIVEKNLEGLVSIASNFDIQKGDIVQTSKVSLSLFSLKDADVFSYFYYSRGILFTVYTQSIHTVGYSPPHRIIREIDSVRILLLEKIHTLYPREEALFLGGILLGAREAIPADLKTDFNNSGLTHFIAVSGFNITIVIIFLGFLIKPFPVWLRAIIIPLGIISFTLLVGDSAPVVRASLMGIVAYYILLSGRDANNLSLIGFVAAVMLIFSPLSLNYDVSFQLSFLAVAGIIYTQKPIKKFFKFLPEVFAIKEAFVLTLGALAFCLPIIVVSFGQLPLASPLANALVAWTIPLAMLFGFISILVDFISPTLSYGFSFITWVFLAWDIKIVHLFGSLDWAIIQIDFGVYKYFVSSMYFVGLIFWLNLKRKEVADRKGINKKIKV